MLKNLALLCICVCITGFGQAQIDKKKFFLGLNFPVGIGDNAFNEVQNGIIDIEAGIDITALGPLQLGFSVNTTFTNGDPNDLNAPTPFKKSRSVLISPRLNASLQTKLSPSIGVGYAFQSLNNDLKLGRENMGFDESPTFNGLNLNIALAYAIYKVLYIKAQYDFIRLSEEQGFVNTDFFRNVSLIKIGLGLRL